MNKDAIQKAKDLEVRLIDVHHDLREVITSLKDIVADYREFLEEQVKEFEDA